jgi:hypothetical protein
VRHADTRTVFVQHQVHQGVLSVFVKSLLSSVEGNPVFMQPVNGWLTVFWMAMIPIPIATGWINSVAYVPSPRLPGMPTWAFVVLTAWLVCIAYLVMVANARLGFLAYLLTFAALLLVGERRAPGK